MKREVVSNRQVFGIVSVIIFSQAILFSGYSFHNTGAWLSMLIALVFGVMFYSVFAYVLKKNPGKNIFDILIDYFGKIVGRILIALFVSYSAFTAFLTLKRNVLFINILSFPETPAWVIIFAIAISLFLILYKSIEAFSRGALLTAPVVVSLSLLAMILLIKEMDVGNILPLVSEPLPGILKGAVYNFLLIFGDIVILMTLVIDYEKKKYYRGFFLGGLLGGGMMVLAVIANHLVLGSPLVNMVIYPSYLAQSVISVGQFLTRVEVIFASIVLSCLLVKVGILVYSAAEGCSKIYKTKNYRFFLAPVLLLISIMAILLIDSPLEALELKYKYAWVKSIFQIGFPLLLATVTIIKNIKEKLKKLSS